METKSRKKKKAIDPSHSLIVVGGGAAGLMAAIQGAEAGASVTLLEHNEKTGRKICVTGNGRCNLTNLCVNEDSYRGNHPEFAAEVLTSFRYKKHLLFLKVLVF